MQTLIYKNLFRSELLDKSFIDSIKLFNEHKYREAYNSFFDLWHDTTSPNRKLLFQGLVQISAAMKLLEDRKFNGATKVIRSSLKNLMCFEQITKPFNIRKLIMDSFEYFENLENNIDPLECDVEIKPRPRIALNEV
jgi:hypothetical protein